MSEHTTPEGPEPATERPATAGPSHADDASRAPWWRRVPVWAWVAGAAVVLGGGALGVLAASGTFDPEPLPTPPAETITLAPPSPTVEPVERGIEPTAFSAALPDTVLDLALAEMTEGGIFDDADPLESYTLVLSDGGSRSVTVYAAQFQDVEATAAGWPELVADEVEQGEVTADGTVVGEWVFAAVHSETGEPAILWRNSTALLLVTGEEQLVRDVFRAFPL